MHSGVGVAVVVVAALALAACSSSGERKADPDFGPRRVDGLKLPARVEGRSVEAATAHGFVPLFWAGVNLGSTIPGHQPGEVAATRRDYDRWLSGIGDLGARVIRASTRSCDRRSTTRSPPTTGRTPVARCSSSRASGCRAKRSSIPPATPMRRPSRTASSPRSTTPSPSSMATPSSRSAPATRAAHTGRTSHAGCSRTRSASSGTPMP